MPPPNPKSVPLSKSALLAALRAQVASDVESLERRHRETAAGATHEESRAEHAKDTRATEQSYLARGLAERVAERRRALDALEQLEPRAFDDDDAVAVGAIVTIEVVPQEDGLDDTSRETWWLVPGGGGVTLETPEGPVQTVSPVSPLGQALLGLEIGDEGTVRTPRGPRSFEVSEIR